MNCDTKGDLASDFSAIGLFTLVALSFRQYLTATSNATTRCSAGYVDGMPPQEVSRLLHIPLIELSNLPDGVVSLSQVRPGEAYPGENPVCMLEFVYRSNSEPSPLIMVRIYRETNMAREIKGNADRWVCGNYGSDTAKVLGFASSCAATLANANSYFNVVVLTQFPSEVTQSIAYSLKLRQ